MIVKKTCTALFLCAAVALYAGQIDTNKDTLQNKTYNYLFDRIEQYGQNPRAQEQYLKAFLTKAQSEKNLEEQVNGYKNYLYYSEGDRKISYADSMVDVAKSSRDNTLIGAAYLSRGIAYYGLKRHTEALDNYLVADGYISLTNNDYLKYKVQYNIGHVKYYLGMYQEAIVLFKGCLDYFNNKNGRAYLNTIHSLALCYNKIGDYGLCSQTTAHGLSEAKRISNHDMDAYFIHTEGVNQFFRSNYGTAIHTIKESLPEIVANGDFANGAVGNFYIGKSYWAQKKPDLALSYFKKVDRAFQKKGYIRPDLRENYELLIRYYKNRDNPKAVLFYVDQLLRADSVIKTTQSYLFERMHKEYDTKALLREKEEIHNTLEARERNELLLILTTIVLSIGSIVLGYRQIHLKRIWKKKFDTLMLQQTPTNQTKNKDQNQKNREVDRSMSDISSEAASKLVKQLEKWERDKKFLEKDFSLAKLAAAFDTNTKYLSGIIALHRGKKFSEYINDLKIDYIVEQLKTIRKFREYNNKGLAEEAGFTSTQRFTNAFVARTGISPTFFIQELKKKLEGEKQTGIGEKNV